MAKFTQLELTANYDVVDPKENHFITQGIQGADAMEVSWPKGAEAWPAGEEEFKGRPSDVSQ